MKKIILLILTNLLLVNMGLANENVASQDSISSTIESMETAENNLLKSEIDLLIADLPNTLEVDEETAIILKKLSFKKQEIGLFTYATFENGILTISGSGYLSEEKKIILQQIRHFVYAVKIEEGAISIPDLSSMSNLRYVSIPSSIKKIPYGVFYNNKSLVKINIPDGVIEIASRVFSGCESLEKIIIPNSVEKIGAYAFSSCYNLSNIKLPKNISILPKSIFSFCKSLREIEIPQGVVTIGEDAFYNCTGMVKLYIPDSVTSIEEEAFEKMESLREVRMSENVVEIPEYAFKDCVSLNKIVFPASVKILGKEALKGCDNLTVVELKTPELVSIGKYCFEHSKNITSLIVHSKVAPKISNIFEKEKSSKEYYQRATLYVNKDVKKLFVNAENWNKFSAIKEISE